jgi:purine-cytosine permease-like protein
MDNFENIYNENNYDENIYNNNDKFDIYYILKYISENIIGILLLILAIIIVYIVDSICFYNSKMFSIPSPIPGVIPSQPLLQKNRKFKKKIN